MLRRISFVLLVLAALSASRPAAAECSIVDDFLTEGDRNIRSLFAIVDFVGLQVYDRVMPGDVVRFRREGGRWVPVLPPALADDECLRENLEEAVAFYRESIDFSTVSIRMGAELTSASWVFHNRVMIGRGIACPSPYLLVHELAHVWQFQHYQWQLSGGIVDQFRHAFFTDVYAIDQERMIRYAREGRTLSDFNRERQAELFAHYWLMSIKDPLVALELRPLVEPALERRPVWGASRRWRAP